MALRRPRQTSNRSVLDDGRRLPYSRPMERRRFLQWTWQSGVAVLAAAALPRDSSRVWHVEGEATAPGRLLALRIDPALAPGWQVYWQVLHNQDRWEQLAPLQPMAGGWQVVVPYPWDDLRPGHYQQSLMLLSRSGEVLETAEVGHYALRRVRFSA